jgi:hypothetical protein
MSTTARLTAKRLLIEARRLHPPEPRQPGVEVRCPRCGAGLEEPDRGQLLTLLEWSVADLEAADAELGASLSSPYACLTWCPACVRLVVVVAEEVGLEYPRRHERDRQLLRCLAPCPYWKWCVARTGTTCEHCSGKGILVRDDPPGAESPTPSAPPPTPEPAPLPCGHGERQPPPDEPLGEDEEWVWEDDNVEATEAGPGEVS